MNIYKVSEHFENLSGASTAHEHAPDEPDGTWEGEPTEPKSFDAPFTESEVKKLIADLKNGKLVD